MRLRGATDGNQTPIVKALRKAGFGVLILSPMGNGCPDLLVSRTGLNMLMEVKMPDGDLTPMQQRFFASWPGPKCIVHNEREAFAAMGIRV